MAPEQLRAWLSVLSGGGDVVLAGEDFDDPLHAAWRAAHDEATAAYEAWRSRGGGEAFAIYRAAAVRADAAQDALAASISAPVGAPRR
jgi:hypothetical protein